MADEIRTITILRVEHVDAQGSALVREHPADSGACGPDDACDGCAAAYAEPESETCPTCRRVGELPIRCALCGFVGCEICGCDLCDGPSCCDAARVESEAMMARVMAELSGRAQAANARGEAAWERTMAATGDAGAAAVAEDEARNDRPTPLPPDPDDAADRREELAAYHRAEGR